jgi:hypothetical protein
MVAATQSLPNQCYDLLIEPFNQGLYNLRDAFLGTKVDAVAQQNLDHRATTRERELSLAERVSSAVVGLILLIPIVNSIVFKILTAAKSDLIYPSTSHVIVVERGTEEEIIAPPQEPSPPLEPPIVMLDLSSITTEQMIARKRTALARLDAIENMVRPGHDPMSELASRFKPHSQILHFNLDQVLQRYQTAHPPSKLFDFLDWADIPDDGQRRPFRVAVEQFEDLTNLAGQQATIRSLLCHMAEYFEQQQTRITAGSPAEDTLKEQFNRIFSGLIDANRNCTDQMLSQVQTLVIDTIAEGDAGENGSSVQTKILFRAGHALCKYRTNLFKEILVRLDPHRSHMADFERQMMAHVAGRLGLQGRIFTVGAVYQFTDHGTLERLANQALATFQQEYKPVQHLLTELRTYHGIYQSLRNEMLPWSNNYFAIGEETDDTGAPAPANLSDGSPAPHMDARMSEEFTALPASDGGNLTMPALTMMMETLGLIHEAPVSSS